jgi:hypothetical protein
LRAEDVTPDSEIANIIGTLKSYTTMTSNLISCTTDKETQNFKWWPRLHGFWRTLPNFNPYTVTSGPGQDLAGEAYSVLMGGRDEHHSMNLARMDLVRASRFFFGRD